jgi:fructose-specific component phosphotransferase system IIB-like protein
LFLQTQQFGYAKNTNSVDSLNVCEIEVSFAKVGKLAKISQIANAMDPVVSLVQVAGKVIKPVVVGAGKSAKFVFKVSKAFIEERVHFTKLNKAYSTVVPIPIDVTSNIEAAIKKAKELLTKNKDKFDESIIIRKDAKGNPILDGNGNVIADIDIDGQKVEVILSEDAAKAKESVDEVLENANNFIKNSKFIDELLEQDYQKYLNRKVIQGKPPRERLDWKEARDYWLNDSPLARGNAFNKKAEQTYLINELNLKLENGKNVRIDSYIKGQNKIDTITKKAKILKKSELHKCRDNTTLVKYR